MIRFLLIDKDLFMSIRLPYQRVLPSVLVFVALITSSAAVFFRARAQKLATQNQKLLDEIRDIQSPEALHTAAQWNRPSILLDGPIAEKTALSLFWFGDMESHFRNPIDFFVVPDADHRLHKVELIDFIKDDQANVFVSAGEMKRILGGLKSLACVGQTCPGGKYSRARITGVAPTCWTSPCSVLTPLAKPISASRRCAICLAGWIQRCRPRTYFGSSARFDGTTDAKSVAMTIPQFPLCREWITGDSELCNPFASQGAARLASRDLAPAKFPHPTTRAQPVRFWRAESGPAPNPYRWNPCRKDREFWQQGYIES